MLPDYIKENLNACTKEQLIFLIDKYRHSMFIIGEICVDKSKEHISSEKAVDKIIKELGNLNFPFSNDSEKFSAFIDYKMGKIKTSEYRKKLGLDE